MKIRICLFFWLFSVFVSGCVGQQKSAHTPIYYEFALSPKHRTESDITLLSVERDGRVRARIYHNVYFARQGEPFVSRDGFYSEYTLKSVDQTTGQVLIQEEGRAYHN